jgi:molecular chaperone Hsp33
MSDFTQRFLFDDTDVRGELTSLEQSYVHVLAKHTYPAPVAQLLGELLAAATLLVGTLKFDGLLVLQASSSGAVPLLMVECSSEREFIDANHAEVVEGFHLPGFLPLQKF